MSLTQDVHDAARTLTGAGDAGLPEALATFLTLQVGQPFGVRRGVLTGPGNRLGPEFATVVFSTATDYAAMDADGPVPVKRAAAVVDACEELTIERLRTAYSRIGEAKRMRQSLPPGGRRRGNREGLVGVVLGLRSSLTLEEIAEEMQRLNGGSPATEWPDLVAVADAGVVQYGAQFPGENVTGDFFLPEDQPTYTVPMYIVMVMKPAGTYTLNRVLALIVGHLALFAPGAAVPNFTNLIDGIPHNGVTLTGYQCNLAGALVPVPRQFYNDRYLAPLPFMINDQSGKLLATVQYLHWQDGGVILLRGAMPLEMLLVFLGPKAKNGGIVPRPGGQLSYAMPITETDFLDLLKRFQRQSNMVVQPDQTNWVVKKFADEGSASPFMARLLMGMLRLRDAALPAGAERDAFDKVYQSLVTPLLDARERMKKIEDVWQNHERRVHAGEIARVRGRAIHVDENVDSALGQEVDAFLSAATRALKTGLQAVADELGTGIGFLFQKQEAFNAGTVALDGSDPHLAAYLREARAQWSATLVGRRNAVEHENWRLPDVVYEREGVGVRAREPVVDGMRVTEFAPTMFDRVSSLAEDVTAHLLRKRLPKGITITELALTDRNESAPERFRVTLAIGGAPAWSLSYDARPFETR